MSEDSNLAPHPLADLLPAMGAEGYEELKADIVRNGLQIPIILYKGLILDGRTRYRACKETGIPPRICNYEGDDPATVVASMNLHRRHLSPSQRAMVAAKLADSKPGGDRTKPQNCVLTHGRAAAHFKISKRLVDLASALLNAAAAGEALELVEQVSKGEISLNKAMRVLKRHRLGGSSLRASHAARANEIVRQSELLCQRMDLLVADVEKTTTPVSEIRRLLAHTCDKAKRCFGERAVRLRSSELPLLPVEDA
jgi:ParB-like chromosome segregation protein Spo0J